ncbi:MAG: glycosyltransferase family 4 protein [Nitrospirota bacterium]
MHKRVTNRKPKILFLVTEDWYFCSHRLPIARAARDNGYSVVVATRVQSHGDQIEKEGFKLVPISMRRSSKNPFKEILSILEITKIYRSERPDIVHHVAMKPVLYGSIAALFGGIGAVVNALAGMGYIFTSHDRKAKFLKPVVKLGFRFLLGWPNGRVIIQNPDDRLMMIGAVGIPHEKVMLIKGSGVDTSRFAPTPEPEGPVIVALVSRMLWDKGIKEFVEAAQIVKKKCRGAQFVLVGSPDPENPASIPESQLVEWTGSGAVLWRGHQDDIPTLWAQAHIAVLPSYREGLPKALLEAAACGRPIVTTDTTGCREIVKHGKNGFLVPVGDSEKLAEALLRLIENPALRQEFGAKGREIAETEFSQERVIAETLTVYQELLSQ